jgi:DNA polymerase-3 subunit delta'
MSSALFAAIAGQQRLKEHFARLLDDRAVGHAYLFSGREGLAKTAFARELAVALVAACGNCGACADCERARRGLHPDLHLLEREGDVYRVDQVRPILDDLSLRPYGAGHRVWVIPEAEHFNAESANKLLKVIEEPPNDVHFLFVTDRLERMLPTIVSRCQAVEFYPLSDVEIEEYLRGEHGLEGEEGTALARLAAGSIEHAERLALDALGPGRRRAYLREAAALFGGRREESARAAAAFLGVLGAHREAIKATLHEDLVRRQAELEQQFQEKKELKRWLDAATEREAREVRRRSRTVALDALDTLASWLRDLWVVACGASDVLCNCDMHAELVVAAVAAPEHYARLLAELAGTRKDLYLNVSHELALKALFARFTEVAEGA